MIGRILYGAAVSHDTRFLDDHKSITTECQMDSSSYPTPWIRISSRAIGNSIVVKCHCPDNIVDCAIGVRRLVSYSAGSFISVDLENHMRMLLVPDDWRGTKNPHDPIFYIKRRVHVLRQYGGDHECLLHVRDQGLMVDENRIPRYIIMDGQTNAVTLYVGAILKAIIIEDGTYLTGPLTVMTRVGDVYAPEIIGHTSNVS